MKLLIITQKVNINDDNLGFFHAWILEFAKHCEKVTVICLEKGEYELPENVKVLSLGKEKLEIRNWKLEIGGKYIWFKNFHFLISNFCKKIKYIFRFYSLIWEYRKEYDNVFVHMNPEYAVLGGILWKLLGKKIGLWYVHKAVNIKLWLAEKLCDKIFTASKLSFRLASEKVEIVGHGIDIKKFKTQNSKLKNKEYFFKIITVGRISPTKDYESMIKAVDILNGEGMDNIKLDIIGGVGAEDQNSYLDSLEQMVKIMNLENKVKFLGSVQNSKVPEHLENADIFINMSGTGSVDKAVLEAMACGCIPITGNIAFSEILPLELLTERDNPQKLAEKIKYVLALSAEEKSELIKKLRDIIENDYDLKKLIEKIIKMLEH